MTNDQPIDPRTAATLRSALSRRTVLAGAGGIGAAAALAACGTGGTTDTGTAPATAQDESETAKKLRWQNWVEYMDNEGGEGSTLERFEKETGISVNYTTEIEGNESFTDTVQQQLERDQPTGYDIVVLTDWMAGKWILNGWSLTLNKDNIPNWTNLRAQLQEVPFDEGREYTLPWQSGFAGIGVNKALLKELTGKSEIKTIDELWDPKLKGRVTVLDEMRDTIGLILMSQGKELSDFTDADFDAALAELQKQIDSGQVRQVTGNGYLADLESGQVAASTAWSGDLAGNPDLQWIVPESGATYWTDNMIIPQLAAHKLNAERAMNFYYDPQNQADLILGGVSYVTPIPDAQELVAKKDAKLAEDPIVFPNDAFLAKTQIFKVLSPEQNDQYSQAFNDVIGA